MRAVLPAHLKVLRSQLATTLWPTEKNAAQAAAHASHRMLTELLLQDSMLPTLQAQALVAYAQLLDDIRIWLPNDSTGRNLRQQLEQHLRIQPNHAAAEEPLQTVVALLYSARTREAMELVRKVSAIQLSVERAMHAATTAEEPQPNSAGAADESLSPTGTARLQSYLRTQFPDESSLQITGIKRIPGGFSKQTLFVQLANTRTLPATIVLRADNASSVMESSVADELHILQTCFDAGVAVPRPYALCRDAAVIGAPFIVVSKAAGHNIGDAFDVSEPSREFGISLGRTLARLHAIHPEQLDSKVPGADQSPLARTQSEIQMYERRWRASAEPSIGLELAYNWLNENIELADGRRRLIHRDVGCHNILFEDGQITALLDWESAVIGNPAQDLGYAYHTIVQVMPWDDFLGEYSRAGGEAPPFAQVNFYRLWRAVWLATLLLEVRRAVASGATTDFGLVYNSLYQFRLTNQTLREVLDELL